MSIFLSPFHKPKTNKDGTQPKTGINKTPRLIGLLSVIIFSSIFLPLAKVRAGVGAHLAHAVVGGLLFIILSIPILIGGAFAKISAIFMQHTLAPNFLPFKFTQLADASGNPTFIGTGWVISRDLSYMIIVIALIAAGLGIALRIFEAQKILAAIVVAAIVIPFTPLICGLVIDPANILTNTFLKTGATTNITSFTTIIKDFGDVIHNRINASGPSGAESDTTGGRIVNSLVFVITIFMIAIAMFLYGVLFIVRDIALSFIVIFSPLAVVASIFPYTKKWFSQWFEQLIGWAFVTPLAVFFLYLTGEMIQTLYTSGGAKSLGLGTIAYFMIPPITMYAGLAAISAAGPAGAKATVGLTKKQGRALVGKGLKWGGEKFASSKLGKRIGQGMTSVGGEIRNPNETVPENASKAKKALAWMSYGIRRGTAKAVNVAGQKLGNVGHAQEEAANKKAEKNLNRMWDETHGNIAEFSKKVHAASFGPSKRPYYNAAYKKMDEEGVGGEVYKKNPSLYNSMIKSFYKQGEEKKVNKMAAAYAGNTKGLPEEIKNIFHKQEFGHKTEDTINTFLDNNTKKVPGHLKEYVSAIINKQLGYNNLDKEVKFSNEEKAVLKKAGVGINDLVKSIKAEKGETKGIDKKIDVDEAIRRIGVKSIKAKDIREGHIDKNTLTNSEVIKEFLKQGKVQELRAAGDVVQGNYAQSVIDLLNNRKENPDLLKESVKKNPGLAREVLKPASVFFQMDLKDEKGNVIKSPDQARALTDWATGRKGIPPKNKPNKPVVILNPKGGHF